MIRDIGNLCDPGGMRDRQMFRNQRADLSGIAVDGLLTEHEHVELDALQLLDLLLGLGQDVAGGQGVGAAADHLNTLRRR